MRHSFATTSFTPAYVAPLTGVYRTQATDFQVDEQMDIVLSGKGEHLWLKVRKTGSNTDWVAGQLARCAGIKEAEVGYAGLKDRHAVTTQWFSMQLAGKPDPDFSALPAEIEILEQNRHDKKLRRGALTANHFKLIIRQCQCDFTQAQTIIEQIKTQGMPNYFGEQRFGNESGNLEKALQWFKGEIRPKQRQHFSLYLSAARSWIFNHILNERVKAGNWNQRLAGDVFVLDDSHSWFADDNAENLTQRLNELDIHPSGALWGEGELPTQGLARELELAQAQLFPEFCAGLEKNRLNQERRALRVKVQGLALKQVDFETLELSFELPAGAYATVLLAQFGAFHQAPVI